LRVSFTLSPEPEPKAEVERLKRGDQPPPSAQRASAQAPAKAFLDQKTLQLVRYLYPVFIEVQSEILIAKRIPVLIEVQSEILRAAGKR
jgi:hypothetical protein